MFRVFIYLFAASVHTAFLFGCWVGAFVNSPTISPGPSDADRAKLTRLVRMVQKDAVACSRHPELQRCNPKGRNQ